MRAPAVTPGATAPPDRRPPPGRAVAGHWAGKSEPISRGRRAGRVGGPPGSGVRSAGRGSLGGREHLRVPVGRESNVWVRPVHPAQGTVLVPTERPLRGRI